MSIASEIQRLQGASSDIAAAITAKGVAVPSGSGYDDYASLIASISQGGGGGPQLPYTPLDYIETDGVAYIDSGVIAKPTMSFDLKVKINASISTSEIFVGVGSTDGAAGTLNGLWHSTANSGTKIGYGYYYLYASILTPTGFTNPFEVSTRLLKGYCVMGIKEQGSSSYTSVSNNRTSTVSSSQSLYIFATNVSGSPTYKASSGSRIYYIKIISGGSLPNLAFDGVPALYNGEYGLWDRVSNSFFGNAASSGTFTGA